MPSGVEGTKAFALAVQYLSKHQDEVYNSTPSILIKNVVYDNI
jgi:hypothetical protein